MEPGDRFALFVTGAFVPVSQKRTVKLIQSDNSPAPTPVLNGTNRQCGEYYLVAKGDDCSTLTAKYSIELKDFLFLNSEVSANCTNLQADAYYCVRPVGFISTYPGYDGSPTTEPFEQMPSIPLPNIGDLWANLTSDEPIIQIANNTRVDCYRYVWFDNLTENEAADCWSLAMVYGVTAEELILWNPSLSERNGSDLGTTETTPTLTTGDPYAYPCTLSANSSYCVALMSSTALPEATEAPPSPRAPGEIANCTMWYAPKSYSTCQGILTRFYLTIDEFYSMNPTVGASCQSLSLGTYYCVSTHPGGIPPPEPYTLGATTTSRSTNSSSSSSSGIVVSTPTPTQTGMVGNCNAFYKVVKDDSCFNIAADHGITLDTFYAWNPAVRNDCSGLQADVYVCIGIIQTTTPTSMPSATTTQTGIITPTPTQTGMVNNCADFYLVKTGDSCWAIANDHGIDPEDFYAWNPAVKNDCTGLQAMVYRDYQHGDDGSVVTATGRQINGWHRPDDTCKERKQRRQR
ncbi:hypothetical protein O1611_g4853 [Lasiodiplodia mahajangana]|uniref:Uncharacterized protein n=1 Tax=Lasiodiplodia mahajangana TaxID=1108764 RepID=A0ACC2JMQ6_9PEZI|nr:hypothetical protein O1611_g4853 [Lasiodiplodia mahajangana]